MLIVAKHIKPYMLEKCVDSPERAISLRRKILATEDERTKALMALPYAGYDYSKVRKNNWGRREETKNCLNEKPLKRRASRCQGRTVKT